MRIEILSCKKWVSESDPNSENKIRKIPPHINFDLTSKVQWKAMVNTRVGPCVCVCVVYTCVYVASTFNFICYIKRDVVKSCGGLCEYEVATPCVYLGIAYATQKLQVWLTTVHGRLFKWQLWIWWWLSVSSGKKESETSGVLYYSFTKTSRIVEFSWQFLTNVSVVACSKRKQIMNNYFFSQKQSVEIIEKYLVVLLANNILTCGTFHQKWSIR